MKLNIRGWAVASGVLWAIYVCWIIVLAMMGKGTAAFDSINQIYLNLMTPTAPGLIIGVAIAFIDASIAGAIFAWIYNKLAK